MLLDYLLPPDTDKLLYARDGWVIPTEKAEYKNEDLMKIKSNELLKHLPKGTLIRSYSTYPYNCVGMIFAARRNWIEIDYIYEIFRHDGYRQIRKDDAFIGDVVLYKQGNDVTHVALIIQIVRIGSEQNIRVLSKWGYHAEYEHFIEDVIVEQIGKPAEFWTERKL